MKNKPILLATDMTARCDRPLDRALMLAKLWETNLVIVHVVDPKKAKKGILVPHDVALQIEEELPETDVDIKILVELGDVGEEVLFIAKREACGLIVTGVAHYDGLGDIFLGSPADHIVRNATIPVLVVKRKPAKPYNDIVIATDFSDCSLHALNTAAAMFPKSPLHLVHAFHVPYSGWLKSDQVERDIGAEENKLMERFLARTTIDNSTFGRLTPAVEKGDLPTILHERIKATKADLVVIGTHGRSGLTRATMGSNARILLGWLNQDVLMVRD